MRDPRLARRMSQAPPRMSIVFNSPISLNLEQAEDIEIAMDEEGGKVQAIKNFCGDHLKSIVTLIMMFGMVFCIVMIVLVHKWNFEKTHGIDWNFDHKQQALQSSSTTPPVYSYVIHETFDGENWQENS